MVGDHAIEFISASPDTRVKPTQVRLFIKPYCGWCHKAIRWLDDRGVHYDVVDVTASEVAWEEMIRLSGQELAPVIEVDGRILADFGPEQLAEFWKKLESDSGSGNSGPRAAEGEGDRSGGKSNPIRNVA